MERQDPPFEIHLQNGFQDDPVTIERNGVVETQVVATTRFQIGAADVIGLHADEEDEITIRLPATGDRVLLSVSVDQPYILVQKEEGQLQVEVTDQAPRYA